MEVTFTLHTDAEVTDDIFDKIYIDIKNRFNEEDTQTIDDIYWCFRENTEACLVRAYNAQDKCSFSNKTFTYCVSYDYSIFDKFKEYLKSRNHE